MRQVTIIRPDWHLHLRDGNHARGAAGYRAALCACDRDAELLPPVTTTAMALATAGE